MANVVTHLVVSAKADGADNTIVQPGDWNAAHSLTGGNNGALLLRDTGEADGANWLSSVAVGMVLASNGAAADPIYTTSPALTALTLSGDGPSMRLASSNAQLFIGVAADPGWGNGVVGVQIGAGGAFMTPNAGAGFNAEVVSNAYHDGAVYRYITTSHAARIQVQTGPKIGFATAPSGSSGTGITFTEMLSIDANAVASQTGLNISVAGAAVQRVLVGAANSGGSGLRALCVAN